jgi:hypothetical protein
MIAIDLPPVEPPIRPDCPDVPTGVVIIVLILLTCIFVGGLLTDLV